MSAAALTAAGLTDALGALVHVGVPALTIGPPGIGKTDCHQQLALALGMDFVALYPATLDPTDVAGLPVPVGSDDARRVERLLDDQLYAIATATRPTLVLLDELGQASPAVQAACAPLLLARTVGRHRLPAHVWIGAASNRRADRAGAASILTHLISRVCVLHMRADLDSYCAWAPSAGISAHVVAFLRARPTLLHDFDAEAASAGTTPYACPRSWQRVSRVLSAGVQGETLYALVQGSVGEGAATEFLAHYRLSAANVDIDAALANPLHVPIPTELALRYALAVGVAYRTAADTAAAVLTLADRLMRSKLGEFGALIVRDAFRSYPDLGSHPAWLSRAAGDLGAAIRAI